MTSGEISAAQRLYRMVATPRTPRDYLACARWWEWEARRGYESAASLRYAANMRWAKALALTHGPGTWLELIARANVSNPESRPK